MKNLSKNKSDIPIICTMDIFNDSAKHAIKCAANKIINIIVYRINR